MLPDLFAGKMHAVLCRRWQNRSKGRDWYDLVWYAGNYPKLNLAHLEQRMRQSGHWEKSIPLSEDHFKDLVHEAIENLDVKQVRKEVEPFLKKHGSLQVWSREFFKDVVRRIQVD